MHNWTNLNYYMEIDHINQILNELLVISSSYDRVADATGERFNLFSLLGVETNEVSTHSRFIGELLNKDGTHGQNTVFLKAFIKQFNIADFDLDSSIVSLEHFIGNVSENSTVGGRIDILIRNEVNKHVILIENKIYALEQKNQLTRYKKQFPNSSLFFLTLFGESSNQADNDLLDYYTISYSVDMIRWLEECRKESANVPILRESIGQYINLVKKLTYQNLNQTMDLEIVKRILIDKSSFRSVSMLVNSRDAVRRQILIDDIFPLIRDVANEFELFTDHTDERFLDGTGRWLSFSFNNEKSKKLGLYFGFMFNVANGFNQLMFGIAFLDKTKLPEHEIVKGEFKQHFGKVQQSANWLCYTGFSKYSNWDDFQTLYELRFGDFKDDFRSNLITMLQIIDSVGSNVQPNFTSV